MSHSQTGTINLRNTTYIHDRRRHDALRRLVNVANCMSALLDHYADLSLAGGDPESAKRERELSKAWERALEEARPVLMGRRP